MTILIFAAGVVVGAVVATAVCLAWGYRAMGEW